MRLCNSLELLGQVNPLLRHSFARLWGLSFEVHVVALRILYAMVFALLPKNLRNPISSTSCLRADASYLVDGSLTHQACICDGTTERAMDQHEVCSLHLQLLLLDELLRVEAPAVCQVLSLALLS